MSPYIGDEPTLNHASSLYDDWLHEKGLLQGFSSYEITKIVPEKGSNPPAYIVSVLIDNKPFKMRVPKKSSISWAE